MDHATNPALGVVGHHVVVRVYNPVGKGLSGLECFFDPAAQLGLVSRVPIVTGLGLMVVQVYVFLESRWEESAIWAGQELDGEEPVWQAVLPLLERGFDFPVHVTPTMGAASDQDNRYGSRTDVLFPDPAHDVVRVGAVYEVVSV